MRVASGYETLTPTEIGNVLIAVREKRIPYRALRVWLACAEMTAIRAAARRVNRTRRQTPCEIAHYRISELERLTGLGSRTIRAELSRLQRASLLEFSKSGIRRPSDVTGCTEGEILPLCGERSPKRPIPVPRSILRFIAACPKRSVGLSAVGYMLRGVTIDRDGGEPRGVGTVKASWLARILALSLRSAKSARKALISEGIITKDTGSVQRKLNRHGAYFVVNLDWKGTRQPRLTPSHTRDSGIASRRRFSPLRPGSRTAFSPPLKDKKTPNRSKNQKSRNASGVSKTLNEPSLKNIRRDDLANPSAMRILFTQAVRDGWLQRSEANLLNWFAASIRAQSIGARDPVRVFVALVKRNAWHFITQEQEGRARELLRERGEKLGLGFSLPPNGFQKNGVAEPTRTERSLAETVSSLASKLSDWKRAPASRSLFSATAS